MRGGKPLRTLIRILIISAIFLTIGLYVSVNDKSEKGVLLKDHSTSQIKELAQKKQIDQPTKPLTERPKEGLSLLIGQDVIELEKGFGKPERIDPTIYGYEWYIYNVDYNRYLQVGVEKNKVVTVYVIGADLDVSPFEMGQPIEEIFNTQYIDTNVDINLNGNSYRFELSDTDLNIRPLVKLGNVYAQLYIDKFTGNLSSVRFLDAETIIKQRPYELTYRGELLDEAKPSEILWKRVEDGTKKEIFDLTNVLRLRHKLKPLKWDEKTAEVAYQHSKDMYQNNDFSHTSKKYGSLADRLKSAKVVYQSAGENIAANYTDGPAVVEGWLNSKGHRDSLLNKDFSHLGVGVYEKYYTQNFVRKWEQ
ncbi:CAP domain-containing protein [Neobacillus sp. PS3-40]|uniref:CAP domain-containing protein n=1 Tax=Neobacillus sp. PS3-40 TaxID=3070679 RepID=UPI0027DF68F2|nr:CAP domain-containing protein [Neobacillus sp. PS3-40]WML43577.1 CAP domain-containing protein [Neobacillus sp. PS3-40]